MSKTVKSECGNVTILADDADENVVYVTESAKIKIGELLSSEDDGSFLRICVIGGGCSGFQYDFGIHDEKADDDFMIKWSNGGMVVDSLSMNYIKGATLDYIKQISGDFFKVDNPGAVSTCGCNSSFSV
jgi:iron-sulfur cluster insertion protein